MGYLYQKKQKFRKNLFFQSSLFITAVLTVLFLIFPHFKLSFFNVFHLYCLSFILCFCALLAQKHKTAVGFIAICTINYMFLSAHCNIFLSDTFKGSDSLHLTFSPNHLLTETLPKERIISSGSLIIANNFLGSYAVLNGTKPLTIVRIDFSKAKRKSFKLIFAHLCEFIVKQDNPIIIFGDFGLPAWDPLFHRFLNKTDLRVKNRLLFTESSSYNIFTTPSFYILGFSDMGIENINVEQTKNSAQIIHLDISFSLE